LSAGWNERMIRSLCGLSMSDCSVSPTGPHYSRRLLLQPQRRKSELIAVFLFGARIIEERSTSRARWRRTWTRPGSPSQSD